MQGLRTESHRLMKRYSYAIATAAVAVIIVCYSSVAAVGGPFRVEAIAWKGDPAPGGGVFTNLNAPSLNNHGEVAFSAYTTADGPTRFWSSALFWGRRGDLHDVARTLTPAPGTNETFYSVFSAPIAINGRGELLVVASTEGGRPHTNGIWWGDAGNLALSAISQMHLPPVHLGDLTHFQFRL